MPNLISQLRSGQPQMQPQQYSDEFINSMKALMRSKSPQEILTSMAASNPQAQRVLTLLSNGMNSRTIAEQMAQERGIDLNELINKLTS